MTNREVAGNPPETLAGGGDCLSLLSRLETNEILEVLSPGEFCSGCQLLLKTRIQSFIHNKTTSTERNSDTSTSYETSSEEFWSAETSKSSPSEKSIVPLTDKQQQNTDSSIPWSKGSPYRITQMQEPVNVSPVSVNSKRSGPDDLGPGTLSSEEQKEWLRFSQVGRKKSFVHNERIHGREVNVLQGLELHTGVFNAEEQRDIVKHVYDLQKMGQKGQLRARTYTEPRKWMRGKGRVTIQFGCCYNYAVDKDGNAPGIIRDEEVDPLPPVFKKMIQRMVRWHILPSTCIPNSCIVNIYDEGDCIPPHIDHHDFVRPFCTVSFLSECNILFGSNLKIIGPGEFSGPISIPLPVGSVLILNGKGADVAKHCVPAVPAKRISVTFRKMDESKIPYSFMPDPELLSIRPIVKPPSTRLLGQHSSQKKVDGHVNVESCNPPKGEPIIWQNDDFPPLGGLNLGKR
ncbi:hypothetical protein Dimus_018107 [Dionaea muscipula]